MLKVYFREELSNINSSDIIYDVEKAFKSLKLTGTDLEKDIIKL